LYDLSEITALTFALWGLVFFFRGRMLGAGVLFGLGALGKDMAFLFAVPVVLSLVIARRWREVWWLAALSFVPYVTWLLVLRVGLGAWSFDARATQFEVFPFGGLSSAGPVIPFVITFLIVPGLCCTLLALRQLDDVHALALLLSFVFLVFLPSYSYSGAAVFRLNSPLVLAGALLMARLRRERLLVICTALWSSSAALSWLLAV
jgi:hypothetical protein